MSNFAPFGICKPLIAVSGKLLGTKCHELIGDTHGTFQL